MGLWRTAYGAAWSCSSAATYGLRYALWVESQRTDGLQSSHLRLALSEHVSL